MTKGAPQVIPVGTRVQLETDIYTRGPEPTTNGTNHCLLDVHVYLPLMMYIRTCTLSPGKCDFLRVLSEFIHLHRLPEEFDSLSAK